MKNLCELILVFTLICLAQLSKAQADSLVIFPNPFQDSCTIQLGNLNSDTVTLHVYNRWGAVVKNYHTNEVLSGDFSYKFYADTLPQGSYVVMYQVNGDRQMYLIYKANPMSVFHLPKRSNAIYLYPNPAQDYIQFELPFQNSDQSYTYQILSSDGKVVSRGNQIAKRINIQDIPKGNYLLRVNQGNGEKFISRFVVE